MLPEMETDGSGGVKKSSRHYFLIVCKIANVALCILAFLMIFFSDMSLDIADDIEEYIGYTPKKGIYPKWSPGNDPSKVVADPAAVAAAAAAKAAAAAAKVPKSTPASGS